MWKPEHRLAAERRGLRYPSDLTDAEWEQVEKAVPPAKRSGRPREVDLREVLNAIFYVLATGWQRKALPKDPPPKSTAHAYFMLWEWDGTLERMHHLLYVAVREHEGRAANPTVAILDVQDRDGLREVLRQARPSFPFIERIFADAGYQGPKAAKAVADTGGWTLDIVKPSDAHRFVVPPKRWIVERSFAWISRNRRLARDFERYARTVAAFVRLAMIRVMLRRLTRLTRST